jgi:hypothetical protein
MIRSLDMTIKEINSLIPPPAAPISVPKRPAWDDIEFDPFDPIPQMLLLK